MKIGRRRAAESWQSSAKLSFADDSIRSINRSKLARLRLPSPRARTRVLYIELSNVKFSSNLFLLLSILPILLSFNLDQEHLHIILVFSSMSSNV